jgi:outer membrane immunogenic protein
MHKLLASVGAGTSLLFLSNVALADGYSAPRGYERPFSWTGFYIGANGGYAWQADRRDLVISNNLGVTLPPTSGFNASGGFGGGQVGYNWQGGPLVLGVEADIQGGSIDDKFHRLVVGNDVRASTDLNPFGTVRGRLGFAFDRVLLYGTGGFAYGNTHDNIVVNGVANLDNDTTRSGWVAGGGLEYAWDRHLSLKVEYQRLDLGGERMSAPVIPPNGIIVFSNKIDHTYDTVRIGLNYRFGEDRYVPLK